MVSVKTSAVFLGPSGVGVLRLFQSLVATMSTLAGLGIGSSGVKEIAEADASGDEARLGRTTQVVRRMSVATGVAGSVATALLCWPLAWLVFGSTERAPEVAVAGIAVALTIVAAGQVALVQGRRRIGDLARITIQSAIAGLLVSAPLYWFYRDAAIVPAMLLAGALAVCIAWHHARRFDSSTTPAMPWREILRQSRRLIGLGVAMMWAGLLSTIVVTATGSMVTRELGSES
ncbi:MAG: oligosaccharide flippase family protein, partial [Planctomycetota bacterium]